MHNARMANVIKNWWLLGVLLLVLAGWNWDMKRLNARNERLRSMANELASMTATIKTWSVGRFHYEFQF